MENLSEAEADVNAALDAAATALFLADPANANATEAEIKAAIAGFDKDALVASVEGIQSLIADEQADVDASNAALLTAGTKTFSAPGGVAQGTDVDAEVGKLVAAELVDDNAYMTKANIEAAVTAAQKAVNADGVYVVGTATKDAVTDGEAAVLVGVYDSAGTVKKADASNPATHYAIENSAGDGFVDAAGEVVGTIAQAIALNAKEVKTARTLQAEASAAANAVTADVSAKGSNSALLVELRDAISELAKAGVDLSDADGSGLDLSALLTAINTALATAEAGKVDAVLIGISTLPVDGTTGKGNLDTGNAALDKVLNAAADKINNRADLEGKSAAADKAFDTTDSGELLAAANKVLGAREGLEQDLADDQQELADTKELISVLESLQDDYEAAVKALEEAQEYFEAEGLELPVSIDGSYTATENSDILLFNVNGEDSAIVLGFESDDILFVGKGFTVNVLEAGVDLANERVGDASVLEVFIQQVGNNTVLSFEQEEFAGNQKTGSLTDIVQVTLTGVDAADVSLSDDGYITIA